MALTNDEIERLYREHARNVLAFFVRRVRRPDVAMDLTAETFAAAYCDRRQFRGDCEEQAVGWIYGIARHCLATYVRRGKVERRALTALGVAPRALHDYEYERIEELAGLDGVAGPLHDELDDLAAEQREALLLRVVQERPYDDVARELGVSEQTARARVSRGLRALRGSPMFAGQGGGLGHARQPS